MEMEELDEIPLPPMPRPSTPLPPPKSTLQEVVERESSMRDQGVDQSLQDQPDSLLEHLEQLSRPPQAESPPPPPQLEAPPPHLANNFAENRSPEPFMLQSNCANCSVPLSVDDFVAAFTLPGKMEQRSVYQMIELIFKGHEPIDDHPNIFKFCSSCGSMFDKILNSYMDFICATSMGSYIYNIRQGIKCEAMDDSIDEREVDMSLFEGLSITLNEGPALKEEGQTPASSRARRGMRTSSRIRRRTQRYKNALPKKRKQKKVVAEPRKKKTSATPIANPINQDPPAPMKEGDDEQNSMSVDQLASSEEESEEPSPPPTPPRLRRKYTKNSPYRKIRGICKVCKMKLPTGTTMSQHLQTHFEYPYTCGDCGMKFRVRSSYNSHVNLKAHRTNNISNKRELDLTKRKSPLPPEYSEQLKALLVITDFKCDVPTCAESGLSFFSWKEWVIHQEVNHAVSTGYTNAESMPDDQKPKSGCLRPCSQCGKKFKNNESMIVHLKCIHLKLRPFCCEICGKTSSTKASAQSHRRIHDEKNSSDESQKQNYLCTLCGSTFKVKTSLDVHEKTHLNLVVMKYECEVCHQKFITPSRLRGHFATAHSEERPFSCDQCDQTFKVKRTLDRHHLRQHVKKFARDDVCELCGKGFRNKTHLKEHLMSVHKLGKEQARISAKIKPATVFRILPDGTHVYPEKIVKPKTCGICNRTYVRREQLFTHLISVHGKSEEEAKDITGLESKRNLLPGGGSTRKKRGIEQQQQQQHHNHHQPLQFYQL